MRWREWLKYAGENGWFYSSANNTKMEAIRCLKRYIAREVYYVIKRQSELVNCS